MEHTQVLKELNDIFIDIIDIEKIDLKDTTTADDVEGWDSLTHIQLVVAFEKHFKIRFTSKEIQSWKTVGELVENIISKSP
jgi:acyl carrier protein